MTDEFAQAHDDYHASKVIVQTPPQPAMAMPSETETPTPTAPEATEKQLMLDPKFAASAREVYMLFEGKPFEGDDKMAARYGIDAIGEFNYNFAGGTYMPNATGAPGTIQAAALLTSGTESQAKAFVYLMDRYDQLPNFTLSGTVRMLRGMIADPSVYTGFGALGAGFVARKTGAVGIRKMLAEIAKRPGTSAAVYTGIEAGAADQLTQGIERQAGYDIDPATGALRTGISAVVGGLAGGGTIKAGEAIARELAPAVQRGLTQLGEGAEARMAERGPMTDRLMSGGDPMDVIDPALAAAGKLARGEKELVQPSLIALQQKPEIKTTGKRGVLLVEDVARYLEDQTIQRHGRVLDPIKNNNDLDLMINDGIEEVNFQLSKPISGETWYEDDVGEAIRLTSKIAPQVAEDEGMRVVSLAISALTSPGTRAGKNQQNSMLVLEELLTKGKMSGKNPENGKYFSGTRGPNIEKSIQLLQHMIETKGIQGTADFLLSEKTVGELIAEKAASGLYKTPTVAGAKDSKKLGALIFGEKVGPFFLNLNGYKDTTADVWFTRSYNRHTGELTRSGAKDEPLVAMPRNMAERNVMKQWNRGVADAVGKNEQANQAILWYFEQNLYHDLGVKSARSESFADGAREFLKSRGIAE